MTKVRVLCLVALLACGGLLIAALLAGEKRTPLERTLSPLFNLVGRSAKDVDRMLSRVMPLDDVDERTLGEALKARAGGSWERDTPAARYLNGLVAAITAGKQRPFDYEAFLVPGPPNAFALPGGIVLVTTELLTLFDSEAELLSVLGHEVGHVERGHCFDAARFQMLASKMGSATLGEIADLVYHQLTSASFSKTQESEADEYGYETLLAHDYQPAQMSEAFAALLRYAQSSARENRGLDPFRDYFSSHPPLELRIENFRERAARWRAQHPEQRMYVGVRNLRERVPRSQTAYDEEWTRS
jgi:predicted Zn-dependent protease